jgi:hypothetical protein
MLSRSDFFVSLSPTNNMHDVNLIQQILYKINLPAYSKHDRQFCQTDIANGRCNLSSPLFSRFHSIQSLEETHLRGSKFRKIAKRSISECSLSS